VQIPYKTNENMNINKTQSEKKKIQKYNCQPECVSGLSSSVLDYPVE
jgi:hypothetical protein